MATEMRQKVRYTGKRTGLQAMSLGVYGVVSVGDTVEVTEDEAERWSTELPMADGKMGSDFTKVGDAFKRDEDEVPAKDEATKEAHLPTLEEAAPEQAAREAAAPKPDPAPAVVVAAAEVKAPEKKS